MNFPPPARNANRSIFLWNSIADRIPSPVSSFETVTTIAAFEWGKPLSDMLIPLVQRSLSSEEEFITAPPGHIQNEYMPRPVFLLFHVRLYSAAGSIPAYLFFPYWMLLMSSAGCSIREPAAKPFFSSLIFFA